ncbi:uncharacterized protein LOC117124224 [Anneissia japonica]|uniref:uncharacterized protein LOC117124224 n=1 Tax=Anneissia japonica TaxID=1529436 RepID=UPI0014255EEE|nr:uncharacterized protein LOC117124224 [Anneissia japonica]
MATIEEISEDKFNNIRIIVSRWYDRRHFVSMLKVVYKDHLENSILSNDKTTIDILNSLYAAGHLSSTDPTLLYETIKLTNQLGLEKKIKAVLPSLPNIREIAISRFSDHRQRIVKFGHALIDDHIQAIDGIHNNPKEKYSDGWCMISDLEYKLKICKGKRMDKFIKKLKTLELDNLIRILKDITPNRKRKHKKTIEDVQVQPRGKKKKSRTPNKK